MCRYHRHRLLFSKFGLPRIKEIQAANKYTYSLQNDSANIFASDIRVELGGYHPTFLPDEALQFADAVVMGDAERLWEQVIRDARAMCLQ